MVNHHFTEMPPAEVANLDSRRRRLVDYWNAWSVCDDSGGTSWDVLDEIRMQVTEFLARGQPGDLRQAERQTAKAEFLRQSGSG